MKLNKNKTAKQGYRIGAAIYRPLFPRPICLEKCTMNIPRGYEENILMTLKAFSSEESYNRKNPHKLSGSELWSIDVKSRDDKYRMLYYFDGNICKISSLCTDGTH